ncbi:MAG: LysR family transcriptional regulator [Pseudomonadales bacterium]|nr:LysR family transcriptional regulator [Pseudomonadales bacterium]
MDLRQLKHFMALAEARNFNRASESVGLTQSALTQSISKLEKELDLQLFIRSKTGSVLTKHGRRLLDHAKVISGQFEAANTELKARARHLRTEVRVGVINSLSDEILIRAVSMFQSAYPDYNVKIVKDWSPGLAAQLAEGEIDFAFLSDHFLTRDMPEIERQPLFRDHVRIVVGEKHPLYRHRKPTLPDLANQQWVAVSTSPDWPEFLARVFASADIEPPRHVVRTNSMTLATLFIVGGHAVGLVSPKLFHSSSRGSDRVKYFSVPEFDQERQFSICRRARMVVRPFHQRFMDNLQTAILEWIDANGSD